MALRGEPFVQATPVGNGLEFGAASSADASAAPSRRVPSVVGSKDADSAVAPEAVSPPGEPASAVSPPHLLGTDAESTLHTPGETTIDSVFTVPGTCNDPH